MDTGLQYIVQVETAAQPLLQEKAQEQATTNPGRQAPLLSIILPTRNESGNVHLLLSRIESATQGIPTQVVFVDDSTDETPQVIQEIGDLFPLTTTLIVRKPEERTDGLGGAVVRGLQAAQAPWVCVMDADLQHPPEIIPLMLDRAQKSNADMVIASRRTAHSNAKSLGAWRTAVSRSLDTLARMMFPSHLRKVSDPLTGFFLLRKEGIQVDQLRPRGFKILLEILVRFPKLRVAEVPFEFGTRHAGKSKASPNEVFKYLSLLWTLRFGNSSAQFIKFGVVGVTGIIANSAALAAFTGLLGLYYLVSTGLATVVSTSWNFALTEWWVFGARQENKGIVGRFGLFFVMNSIALLMREPLMYALTDGLHVHYLISNLISLGVLTVARYLLADSWIWGKSKKPAVAPALTPVPLPKIEPAQAIAFVALQDQSNTRHD